MYNTLITVLRFISKACTV